MEITKVSESEIGTLLSVNGGYFRADVRVGPGMWPSITIVAFGHSSGDDKPFARERSAIRRAVKKWIAEACK